MQLAGGQKTTTPAGSTEQTRVRQLAFQWLAIALLPRLPRTRRLQARALGDQQRAGPLLQRLPYLKKGLHATPGPRACAPTRPALHAATSVLQPACARGGDVSASARCVAFGGPSHVIGAAHPFSDSSRPHVRPLQATALPAALFCCSNLGIAHRCWLCCLAWEEDGARAFLQHPRRPDAALCVPICTGAFPCPSPLMPGLLDGPTSRHGAAARAAPGELRGSCACTAHRHSLENVV
eukprot:scaffold377_cov563-Prasinococcus_capsulatus_cf.AAC.26